MRASTCGDGLQRRSHRGDLTRAHQALALLAGRDYALPDDIRQLAPLVLAHRILMTPDAELEGATGNAVVVEALTKVGYKTPRR